jgi:serine kinase of HPr protein (carbohydrate metabolism regulator)
MSHITINDLIEYDDRRLGLTLLAGKAGIKGTIEHPIILICSSHDTDFREKIKDETILIISRGSIQGKEESSLCECEDLLGSVKTSKIALIILSEASDAPDFLLQLSEEGRIPLLCSENNAVLIKSGLMGMLRGRSKELTRHYMEIRGLGIVDIKNLFGIAAVGDEIVVDMAVELVRWEIGMEFSRIEPDEGSYEIMGVPLPIIRVPVRSGGNMATVVEIVARNFILKTKGYSPSREREERILDKTKRGGVH